MSKTEDRKCPACGSANVIFNWNQRVYNCEECCLEYAGAELFTSLRVFLSYGHDEHISLAERLRDDLRARGHEVWFDAERIKPGLDWERYIEEGLEWAAVNKAHAAVVLLLTPHSVRRPDGYCLNEVARALARGLRIIPVMVVDTEPPLSICRTQWLDMRDCIPIQDKEAFYRPKYYQLIEALESGRLDFEGTQQRLLRALQPLEFDADILRHLDKFIGRQWVFDRIDAWLAEPSPRQRVFWVTGSPGVGKTALCAWLSSRYLAVAALHMCKYGHAQKSDPRKVVTSIAYQLTTQLPGYAAKLAAMDVEVKAQDDSLTMFDNLIVQPLTGLDKPNRPIVILIDALDEATRDGRNELASFIAAEFPKTPAWLRLIITSRPEDPVMGPLQGLDPFILDTAIQQNLDDIRLYLKRELAPFLQGRQDEADLIERIIGYSEGVFLYVERLCADIARGILSINAPESFPKGLGESFWQFFERQFPNRKHFQQQVRPALRTILAAREPLPIALLKKIFGWLEEDLNDFRGALGSLFSISEEGGADSIKPYHKAVGDWLADKAKSRNYYVSPSEGHRLLAKYGWQSYQGGIQFMDKYFLCHLPAHLLAAADWGGIEALLTDLLFLEAKVGRGRAFDLIVDYADVLKTMPNDRPQRRTFLLLDEAVRRDIHFIARHAHDYPQALFQCLWNSCWWYDCPASANHYEVPEEGTERVPEVEQCGLKMYELLEQWRHAKEDATPGFPWVRSLRPPSVHLGTAQRAIFRGHKTEVRCAAYSPDGHRIVSGGYDNMVRVWDAGTGAELLCLEGHENGVMSVVYSSDGDRIISGAYDKKVRVWNAHTGSQLLCLSGHKEFVRSVACSPDGTRIVSGGGFFEHTVRIWDASSGALLRCLEGHRSGVCCVAFSPNGRKILSGSSDNTFRVWDVDSGEELLSQRGHRDEVLGVAFSPDGRRIVSGSEDRTLRVWDAASGEELLCLRGHRAGVSCVAFSPDGRRIVSGSRDNTVRVWDTDSGMELGCLWGHEYSLYSVAFSPNGRRIVSGSSDRTIRVWDVKTRAELRHLRGHKDRVTSVACAHGGRRQVITGSWDKTVRVWDLDSGMELRCIRGHQSSVESLAYSPDDCLIVSGGGTPDNTVRVWEADTGNALRVLNGHEDSVISVACSPDGHRIVSGSTDYTARVWDADTGSQMHCLRWHQEAVHSVAYSPDGRWIASGGGPFDNTVQVWDAESGVLILRMGGHERSVTRVAYSADGQRIVSRSNDDTVRVWDADTGECLGIIRGDTDGAAVADGWGRHYVRALIEGTEAEIQDATTGQTLAWFVEGLENIGAYPEEPLWTGTVSNYLCIIRLEGTK